MKLHLIPILAVRRWIAAAVLYFKQRSTKSKTSNVRLLQPHAAIPKPRVPTTDVFGPAAIALVAASDKSSSSTQTSAWSLELLHQVKLQNFTELVAAYFREAAFRAEIVPIGVEEGVEIRLFEKGKQELFGIVHCQVSNTQRVGVRPVRELLGGMTHEKAPRGVYVTTGDYTQEATDFVKEQPIILMSGEMLVNDILSFSDDAKTRLMNVAAEGGLNATEGAPEIAAETEMAAMPDSADVAPDIVPDVASDVFVARTFSALDFPIHEIRIVPDDAAGTGPADGPDAKAVKPEVAPEFEIVDLNLSVPAFDAVNTAADVAKEKEANEKTTKPDGQVEKDPNALDFPIVEIPESPRRL